MKTDEGFDGMLQVRRMTTTNKMQKRLSGCRQAKFGINTQTTIDERVLLNSSYNR